jgi:K(+)-stimulated pyrophosphate-energized sodium pump
MGGLLVCALGMLFGLTMYTRLRDMPVHESMREVSELIYETCKTYLATQGKFLILLELFIGSIIAFYYGFLMDFEAYRVAIILIFSVIGIAGSFFVAAFGMRVNTFANSRTAHASLTGKAFPCYDIPLKAGMSIGMVLISVELLIMLCILLFMPRDLAGPCFIGFAIGESLGAAALRVAGGIFTKIADIGSDLMKIVFKIKEDDARNPGVIADCTGDNAGDSVGPSADGFETYGVTGVALIVFIMLAVTNPVVQVQLLVWIFAMRIMMVISCGLSYFINNALPRPSTATPTSSISKRRSPALVWLTSLLSIGLTFVVSYFMIPSLAGDAAVVEARHDHQLRHACRRADPGIRQDLHVDQLAARSRIVTSSREGGASLNILSGLVAGNMSAYWLGMAMISLMGIAYGVSSLGLGLLMVAPAVFAFGLVAFGFLGMGPVTIAVDSYGPVTDNAQSVYELSMIEEQPGIVSEMQKSSASSRFREGPKKTWKRTMARATRSRRPPSPCSSARPSWAPPP